MAVGYCVSVQHGSHRGLVAGPYHSHQAALDDVERVSRAVVEVDPRAHFYGWGTARAEAAVLREGNRNTLVGVTPRSAR
jgi:hypothetical protein